MFITENQNVADSVLFLLAARTALSNIVESSNNPNKDFLVDFLHEKATDYQIIHLLLKGELPKQKYDEMGEMLLFSDFKQSMMLNKGFVSELVGEDIFNNVLYEVDSLYMEVSTTAPILEFMSAQDGEIAMATMIHHLNEVSDWEKVVALWNKAKAAGGEKLAAFNQAQSAAGIDKGMKGLKSATKEKLAALQRAGSAENVGKGVQAVKGKAGEVIAKGKAAVAPKIAAVQQAGSAETIGKGVQAVKGKAGEMLAKGKAVGGKTAAAIQKGGSAENVGKAVTGVKQKVAGVVGKYTGNTAAQKAGIANAAAPGQKAAAIAARKAELVRAAAGSSKGKAATMIGKGKSVAAMTTPSKAAAINTAGKVASQTAQATSRAKVAGYDLATKKAGALGNVGKAVSKFAATPAGYATGGAAAAALAIYAGYKIYKRMFSQAAKSCAGQKGAAKTLCMNKYKKAAIMKQASAIQSASGTCAKSKDPAKCKAAVATKVASLKAKAARISA